MSTIGPMINKPKDLILVQLFFGGLIFIGLFMKFLSGFMPVGSSIGEATITIWGYSIILFSLLGLIIIQVDPNNSQTLTQLTQIPFTIYILAVIVLWIIILNINYKLTFIISICSTIFFLFIILYSKLFNPEFKIYLCLILSCKVLNISYSKCVLSLNK